MEDGKSTEGKQQMKEKEKEKKEKWKRNGEGKKDTVRKKEE